MTRQLDMEQELCAVNRELGDKSYYPFSGKEFEFHRAVYTDLMKMPIEDMRKIADIRKNPNNIFNYKLEVEKYIGKVPDSFSKDGVFLLGFENFSLCCYIDITTIECSKCIVFDVIHHLN